MEFTSDSSKLFVSQPIREAHDSVQGVMDAYVALTEAVRRFNAAVECMHVSLGHVGACVPLCVRGIGQAVRERTDDLKDGLISVGQGVLMLADAGRAWKLPETADVLLDLSEDEAEKVD